MLTIMRAKLAAGRARDSTSDTGRRAVQPVAGSLTSGADDRIITTGNNRLGTPARVLAAVLIGLSLAAVFGSGPALRWTETLPDGRLTAALHDAAAKWNDTLSPLGASRPHDWLRATIRAFEAMHF